MTSERPTALIADDEPLLRTAIRRMLAEAWPELEIVAEARNGREAIERFEALAPEVCFLDVHMPGVSGIEAARAIGKRARLVFVTAYDQYAVQAFEHEAIDYLVKPRRGSPPRSRCPTPKRSCASSRRASARSPIAARCAGSTPASATRCA